MLVEETWSDFGDGVVVVVAGFGVGVGIAVVAAGWDLVDCTAGAVSANVAAAVAAVVRRGERDLGHLHQYQCLGELL